MLLRIVTTKAIQKVCYIRFYLSLTGPAVATLLFKIFLVTYNRWVRDAFDSTWKSVDDYEKILGLEKEKI